MQNKTCFASIDVEKDLGQEKFHGVENLDKILNIFKKYEIPATLFVTGEILEKHRDKFLEWSKHYEIACHSFTHCFWNTLNSKERQKELDDFINLYQKIFSKNPLGFRAPSHLIDESALELLNKKGFLYDSSVLPHYVPFKKYRGYQGRKPLLPYHPRGLKILEIPVRGQIFGIPLAGAWISKLPFWFYKILFFLYCPKFITLNIHSWDSFKNFDNILNLLKKKNYIFFDGEQILQNREQK